MRELSLAAWEHFKHPCHVGSFDSQQPDVAAACVDSPVGGEILQLHLRIDEQGVINAVRFKTYGCGWMIACGSLLAETLIGQTLMEAAQFRHHQLIEQLAAPPEKLHCAALTETALKVALHNYAARRNFAALPVSSNREP
ncbi:MAG: iron-sulfur cluster assembly scaffold protein [Candidatus Competibacteraceae bacterium]|nr:iron-sulfur cluster assembly scaffold protein [Candidatus Competibacteraceae bacterium]MCP5125928.1 iron-sulfur cluster assembly scaffold protein [Gammaproteobacteria bacterium]HRX69833.1 iron-sulfur cluster assembly scaffold protein [Candidatus Competibacteraceae bacterium]